MEQLKQLSVNTALLKKLGPALLDQLNKSSQYSFVGYKNVIIVLNIDRDLDFDIKSACVEYIIFNELEPSDCSFLLCSEIDYHYYEDIVRCSITGTALGTITNKQKTLKIKLGTDLKKISCFETFVNTL